MDDIKIYHGNYAFPTRWNNPELVGMTLRDYFAANASEQDISEHQAPWTTKPDTGRAWETLTPDCSRETAKFRYAEAMLKAREAK